MTYATVSDVATELGRPTPTDAPVLAQWNSWLRQVEARIKVRVVDLDTRAAANSDYAALVADVEASVVARKVLNPEGLRSVTTSIDDGSLTKMRDSGTGAEPLALTDQEWALLLPTRPTGAFTIRPQFG